MTTSFFETSTELPQMTQAAQLQFTVDDENGETHHMFLIVVLAISTLVILTVLSIFCLTHMTKKNNHRMGFKKYIDGNSIPRTSSSPANIKQPQPEMLLSQFHDINVSAKDHHVSGENYIDLNENQMILSVPSFVTTTVTQHALPAIFEEGLSKGNHMQNSKTEESKSYQDKNLYGKRLQYEIISPLMQNDDGVIITSNDEIDGLNSCVFNRENYDFREKYECATIKMASNSIDNETDTYTTPKYTSNVHKEGTNDCANPKILHDNNTGIELKKRQTDYATSEPNRTLLKNTYGNQNFERAAFDITTKVSSGQSPDIKLKSAIYLDSMAHMHTLPPVETTCTSVTPDSNTTTNRVNRSVTPGIRLLSENKYPILVNANSQGNVIVPS